MKLSDQPVLCRGRSGMRVLGERTGCRWPPYSLRDARKPKCDECPLADLCPSVRVVQ